MKRIVFLFALAILGACTHPVQTLFVGTYSDGFYAYRFDSQSGTVVSEGVFAEAPGAFAKAAMPNPSYLTVLADKIYAVSEMGDASAALYSWHFDGHSFEKLAAQPALGADPCYVSTDGQRVAVANYSGGSLALFGLDENGAAAPDTLIASTAGGPDLSRQESPHVHCCVFTPDGKHLVFSEFSADKLSIVDLTPSGVQNRRTAAVLDPDYGPRHILFDPSGKHAYVIGELSGTITVFDYEEDGSFSRKQVVKADKVDARGAADIHFSPDGKFLYASLRLQNDGIAIFSVSADGTLSEVGYQLTGIHPRHFKITPDGRWLLCCCRDSNAVEIYSRNPSTGLLSPTGRTISLPRPVCVTW